METVNFQTMRDDAFIREVEALSGQRLATCYQCGNCSAGCPSAPIYDLQVNQIMRAAQLGLKETILAAHSPWLCVSCSTCTARCPNNIDVAVVMDVMRHIAAREGRVQERSVNAFWQSFLNMVRQFGRTYEMGVMVVYMLRTGRIFTDLDIAPKALLKQKLPFVPHRIEGKEHVAAIFKRYDEKRRKEGGAA